jgi:hypothetical protein
MTSGSLFARDGAGWSGIPDRRRPGLDSRAATDSAVFRLVTHRAFDNVAVSFRWRLLALVTTPQTPARAWDGVHLWLRYRNPSWLYYVSVARRDGEIVIGKKLPGGPVNGGRYIQLISPRRHPWIRGRWQKARATIATGTDGTVTIRLLAGNRLIARAVDRGDGVSGAPITEPGRIGIRGDNANFEFRDLEVRSV